MRIKGVKINSSAAPCIVPYDDQDRENFDKIPFQKIVSVDIKRTRNPKFHDKFMKLCRIVLDNSEKWDSVEQILVALKYQLGLVDLVEGIDGVLKPHPRSIAWDKMDDFEFEFTVYRPALPVLAKEIGVTVDALENEL